MKPRIFIICNVLEDFTRLNREITTDSPAASRKVIMLCKSLKQAGIRPLIISQGRGKANGKFKYYGFSIRRIEEVPILYLPFSHVPIISELLSLFSPLYVIFKNRRRIIKKAIVYYNRNISYFPTLLLSALLGYINILDLEDGEVDSDHMRSHNYLYRFIQDVYDQLCSDGALLACSSLRNYTSIKRTINYYGVVDAIPVPNKFDSDIVRFIIGGTLDKDTGVDLLIESISMISLNNPSWVTKIIFEVTGKGSLAHELQRISENVKCPRIIYHGRVSDTEYKEILSRCDVGLALKLNNGKLSNSTFPSKIVEYAMHGLLVLTTDISDARKVLGNNGALYLSNDDPHQLVNLIQNIAENRLLSSDLANLGRNAVLSKLNPKKSGEIVAEFIFGCNYNDQM